MPGADEIVKHAASESGWIAAMFAALVIGGFTSLGLIVRQLWMDHRELNVFVRDRLTKTLGANAIAFQRLTNLLASRPCLVNDEVNLASIEENADPDSV